MAKRSELDEWAVGFGLLSNPTRLGALKVLTTGPKNVTALCKALGRKEPAISHSVGLLRRGRLVIGTRKGKSVTYCIDPARMKALAAAIVKLTPRK